MVAAMSVAGKNRLLLAGSKKPDQAVADFGKAATVLHTLIHKSVPLTNVQREFIKTQWHTLEVALKIHYPKRPGQGQL